MAHPEGVDWLGYVAAILVFCSFYVQTIVALRLVAITSNMAFIGYAVAKGLYPVLILHVVLLPLNCVRLVQLHAMTKRPKPDHRAGHWTSQSISERSLSDVAPQD
jgi:CRP/FNR family transcriptional regulator, cyclic AMP receptor protein